MFHHALNWFLKRTHDPAQVSKLIKLVSDYPNWLGRAEKSIKVDTHYGFAINCDYTDYIGETIAQTGQWEPLVSRTIVACLALGETAIDVGANIGYDTLLMSKAVGADGFVLSFEPEPTNLRRLYANLWMNAVGNVAVQNIALSDAMGWGRLAPAGAGNFGHAHMRPLDGGARAVRIMTARLDSLLHLKEEEHIGLVKLDIEGFEYKALLGMRGVLRNVNHVIAEVDPEFLRQCGNSPAELFGLMSEYGFSSYCADPESDGRWRAGDSTYRPGKAFTSGNVPFDALFLRHASSAVKALIE
jgi:FkbM family methyltransferase